MNILLVGHICIDENVSEKTTYTSWGSALMYMAKYFKNHTTDSISLLAPYGHDFLEYSKDINIINKSQYDNTLIYKNVSRAGKRTQKCKNIEYAQPVNLDDEIKDYINQADIIVLAPLLPNYTFEYVKELISFKKEGCLTALLPQGYFRNVTDEGSVHYRTFSEATQLLPLFDMVFVSHDEAPNTEELLKLWARQSTSTILILTQGEKGASLIKVDNVVHVSTLPISEDEIVDTVGCGDTFSAATIIHYFYNNDLEAAIHSGNKAAGDELRFARPIYLLNKF